MSVIGELTVYDLLIDWYDPRSVNNRSNVTVRVRAVVKRLLLSKWFKPKNSSSLFSVIDWVSVVLKRTVGDSD